MPNNQIELQQQSLSEVMKGLAPTPRLALGIGLISLFTRYAVLIPITLTGHWANALHDLFESTIVCGILAVQSIISRKTKRDVLVTFIFCIVLSALSILPYLISRGWRNTFIVNWPNVVYPSAVLLLNRFLFLRYKKAVDLD